MAKALRVSEAKRPHLTLAEFYQLPEGPPFYEYEEGALIDMNRPAPRHQRILLKLGGMLSDHVETHTLGRIYPEVNVELLGRRVYTPDLTFIGRDEVPEVDAEDVVRVVPILVVEISSPSTVSRDHFVKLNTYAEAGIAWYWIVDPETLRLLEYHLTEPGHYTVRAVIERNQVFQPGLFPGLAIHLAALLGEGIEAEEAKP